MSINFIRFLGYISALACFFMKIWRNFYVSNAQEVIVW